MFLSGGGAVDGLILLEKRMCICVIVARMVSEYFWILSLYHYLVRKIFLKIRIVFKLKIRIIKF